MGHLRTLLAILVVSFHAYHQGGSVTLPGFFPDGRTAVQLFYVISGFYMAMILNEKYGAGSNWLFYSNRILRLWPPILVVNVCVLLSFWGIGSVILFNYQASPSEALNLLLSLDLRSLFVIIWTNVFVVGQDLLWFLRFDPETGMSFAPFPADSNHNGSSFSLNHPLFTVGIEATCYLIAPFLLRKGLIVSTAAAAIGGLYHVLLWKIGYNHPAWNYHLFLSAFYFFFLGSTAYHLWKAPFLRRPREWLQKSGKLALTASIAAILFQVVIYRYFPASNLFMAILMAVTIPVLFSITANSRADRFIGDLSFGIYLVHFPILMAVKGWMPLEWLFAGTTILSFLAAILLYLSVERPVDRWRRKRLQNKKASSTFPDKRIKINSRHPVPAS